MGDNIDEIAHFTVEKYEFKNDRTRPSEKREAAIAKIKEVLSKRVEELKIQRRQVLAKMFTSAENALDEFVK